MYSIVRCRKHKPNYVIESGLTYEVAQRKCDSKVYVDESGETYFDWVVKEE